MGSRQQRPEATRLGIEARILSLFCGGNEAEAYNISQLARGTGAAYPHAHAAVGRMLAEGLLRSSAVGRSTTCTPDLTNDLARNLLAQADLHRKRQALSTPNLMNLDGELRTLATEEPRLIAAFLDGSDGVRFIVTDKAAQQAILKRTTLINLSFSTPDELRAELLASMDLLKGSVALLGYERFLLILAPIQERLMLNHSALFRPLRAGQGGTKGVRR